MGIIRLIRRYPVGSFFLLTSAGSWGLWWLAGVYGAAQPEHGPLGWRWLGAQVGVFMPALAGALVAAVHSPSKGGFLRTVVPLFLPIVLLGMFLTDVDQRMLFRSPLILSVLVVATVWILYRLSGVRYPSMDLYRGATPPRPGVGWILTSLLFLPLLLLVAVGATGSVGGMREVLTRFDVRGALVVPFLIGLFAMETIYGGSLGEEPGWRGFALRVLERRHSPLTASLVLGVMWGLWHAPLDLSHGFGVSGPAAVLVRLVWTLPLAVLFTWIFDASGGSVVVALLMHTSLNYTVFLLDPPVNALALFTLLLWVAAHFAVGSSGMWRPPSRSEGPRPTGDAQRIDG
jgi:membrane protease YdiL (CAAX protease family)